MITRQLIVLASLLAAAIISQNIFLFGDTAQRLAKERNKSVEKVIDIIRLKETKTLVALNKLDSLGRAYYEGIKGQVPEGKKRKVRINKISRIRGEVSLDSTYALLVKSVSLKANTGDSSSDQYLPEMYLRHEVSLVDENGVKQWTKNFEWTTGAYLDVLFSHDRISKGGMATVITIPDTTYYAWVWGGDFPSIRLVYDKMGNEVIKRNITPSTAGVIMTYNGRYIAFGERLPTVEWKVEWTIHDVVKGDSVKLICGQGEDQPDLYDDGRIEILRGYDEKIYYFDSLRTSIKGIEK